MGPVAASWYTGEVEMKKEESARKPNFPTREELAEKRRLEECKNKVVNQSTVCIGEYQMAITRHIGRYTQEVHALPFFELDHAPLACKVIAIADWVVEFNQLSTHALLEILAVLWPVASLGTVSF